MSAASSPLVALADKVVALDRAFSDADVPYAFGGAIALAYYAAPRATVDIDINVFVPVERSDRVLAVLADLGVAPLDPEQEQRLARDGQARVRWETTALDLFFAYDPLHESCLERRRRVPFGPDGDFIRILAAEDLAVFKVIFDRDKDWRDLREVLFALGQAPDEGFDVAYARRWLRKILPEDDPRYVRFEEILRA